MSDSARYILAKKINRGGMAEIYLGKHIGEDGFARLCAIKRILPHYANDKEFIQMFRDEAHICKRLQHANIVRVEGFEEVEGSYAIIMEFIDGSDLRSVLHACEQSKMRIRIPMACHIIAEAARGLHYAHTKVDEITQQPLGIVHRDISPQNIMISFEGEVKVTDFGIADAESKITETRPGIVKGKYSYMSPEQISAKALDARTDVFALSIVLWEMLSMRRLFQGQNEVETIQLVKNCKIDKNLRELNPKVDEELEALVLKGLARDPKRRFQSAGELEKTLRRFMSRSFPEFTPEDLGSFLKQILDKKRAETAADIKRTLTETSQKPSRRKLLNGDQSSGEEGREARGHLMLEAAAGPSLNLQTGPASSKTKSKMLAASPRPKPQRAAQGQNQFSRIHYGTNAVSRLPKPKPRSGLLAISTVALIAAAALYFAFVEPTFFAAKPPVLVIRTQPATVKLSLNRQQLGKGRYVKASNANPYYVSLPKAGRYTLRVKRPGYDTYTYRFDAQNDQVIKKTDIVLNERRKPAAVLLSLADKTGSTAYLDIDNGYYTGSLNSKTAALSPPDLFPGKTYTMRVYLSKKNYFNCKFELKTTNWKFPTRVQIDTNRRICRSINP